MLSYFLRRLIQFIPTLVGAFSLVFLMISLSPGDPARIMLGERASAEQLENLRIELGLDKPLTEQYFLYLGRLARFDFGKSIKTQRNVIDEIAELFPATLELSFVAMIIATVVGVFMGVIAAVRRNTLLDYSAMTVSLVGVSMPVFWLGLMAIMFFSVFLNLFPTGGRISARFFFLPQTNFYLIDSIVLFFREGTLEYFWSSLSHLILPAFVLGSIPLAVISRTTRSAMLEVLRQDYIRAARSAGIPARRIIGRYALKNAMLTILTVIGVQFGTLLSSAILTEIIFAWPGVGKWMYKAIEARDYPAVQGGVAIIVLLFLAINLSIDLLYAFMDPRIRFQNKGKFQ